MPSCDRPSATTSGPVCRRRPNPEHPPNCSSSHLGCFMHRSRRSGPGAFRPHVRSSSRCFLRGVSGRAARGSRHLTLARRSGMGSWTALQPGDPEGGDQAAKQQRRSEVSTRSQSDPPRLIASQQGMGSLNRICLIERHDAQHLRWSEPMWSPPPESNRRPHPYHGCALPTELGGQGGMCSWDSSGPSWWL